MMLGFMKKVIADVLSAADREMSLDQGSAGFLSQSPSDSEDPVLPSGKDNRVGDFSLRPI